MQIPLINEHLFCNYFVRLSVGNATKGFATYGCFHPCFITICNFDRFERKVDNLGVTPCNIYLIFPITLNLFLFTQFLSEINLRQDTHFTPPPWRGKGLQIKTRRTPSTEARLKIL